VDSKLEKKVILNNISGTVLPGQFLAILGSSGAGKTTLLNYLSGREISMNLIKKGRIMVNGIDRSKIKNYSALSAYVQQDDILFQTLTVRECLEFAAKLKLEGPIVDKMKKVTEIITELRLMKC
jgi:ABC-type multidrug transport system ATPase subunit